MLVKKRCKILYLFLFLYHVASIAGTDKLFDSSPATDSWDVAIYALYLKPADINSFDYFLQTTYAWGFSLSGEQSLTKTKNINVQWLHYRHSQDGLQKRIADYQSEGPTNIDYEYQSDFDLVYFQLAQALDYKALTFILHGGLEYAKIAFVTRDSLTSNNTQTFESKSTLLKYDAVGPVLGIDLRYVVNQRIALYITDSIGVLLHEKNGFTRHVSRDRTTGQTVNLDRVLNEDDSGSTANVYFEAGISYKQPIKNGHIDYQLGWTGIAYDIHIYKWSGAFFGAKLVGDI